MKVGNQCIRTLTIHMCWSLLYPSQTGEGKEVHYKNCHRRHRCPFFVSLLPTCLTGPPEPARESRFQFEITRVAWQTKKWRVSTQNGASALFSLSSSSASLRRKHFGRSSLFAQCHSKVEMGKKWREGTEERGEGSLCLCRKMSTLKCPSLSSSLRTRREGSCLVACLPALWYYGSCGGRLFGCPLQETRNE